MNALDQLEQAMNEVAGGKRIAYLGPEVSALSGGAAPSTPAALCAMIEAQVRAPRRASGNLWSVAQYVESRKFRATLDKIVIEAFDAPAAQPNPVHDWLARVRPPMVVDSWYDDGLLRAFGTSGNWGLVQGVSRNGEWIDIFTRAYDSAGQQVEAADPTWKTLLYKPHGIARAGSSYLISDSDYVEVLTEIDIQRPIPEAVQERRSGRPFLFLGCRFDDQMLRIFARQITKRSGQGHIAVMPGPLTRMERRFLEDGGITWLDLPVSAVAEALSVPEG
ncbi:SIR2 family NAD-dependent protein deacylase [Alloyangia pacifica]|uniref:SIR2-like domain-containing protein n=1 Tax=Alloyangia pacifica TaxID=311180 RepID=A0A1I6QUL8_9RHOB|nr:SIR2 family protein [Alloyangia pacifica]SDF99860.1 SIR2-like domain-containing protein [Alloyangia pacifica]SFS56143.1 SIR2-like domain-containing protein [Alloyangia pacifica]